MGLAVIIISAMVMVTLVGQIGVKQFAKQDELDKHQSMVEAMLGVGGTLFSVLLGLFVAGLVMFLAGIACIPCFASTSSESVLHQRLSDARRLKRDAEHLQRQINAIDKSARSLTASGTVPSAKKEESLVPTQVCATASDATTANTFKLQADQSRREKPASQAEYEDLLQQYKAALNLYMVHRQEIEAHAAAYHTQGEQESKPPPAPIWPINVPRFKPLPARVDDACLAMGTTENELYESELACFSVIQHLIESGKFATASQYLSLWDTAEQQAIGVQQQASTFNGQFLAKQRASHEFIANKVHNAMNDGNYAESRDVYGQEQWQNELLSEEMKRANAYSRAAIDFLVELHALNPEAPKEPRVATGTSSPGLISDTQLEQEFQEVQSLYRKVQDAQPK